MPPDKPVEAVIFDIGATLVTGPPVAPNKVIAALLDGVTAAEVASVIMTTPFESPHEVCDALAARFGTVGDNDNALREICDLWESQSTAAQPIGGAAECVLALAEQTLKIGLLSDIWSPYYRSVERALPEVIGAAHSIVLSCRTGTRKPDKDNFLRALAELGVEPSGAVMVGDTYSHDILPALELGMRAVWVLARPDREIESVLGILNGNLPHPTATVGSIGEVVGAIPLTPSFDVAQDALSRKGERG